MKLKDVRWWRAGGGALVAEIAQIAAAFVWVAVYSHMLNPDQPMAVYEEYAQASGPWVSILAGFPIFYAASRWIARSTPNAMALFLIFLLIDLPLFAVAGVVMTPELMALAGASYATKLFACLLGGRHGSTSARTPKAA